jgi:hypothetical protein
MQATTLMFLSLLALTPSMGACQGKETGTKSNVSKTDNGREIVHHFSETTTIIEHGDTVTVISPRRSGRGSGMTDTLVYVFRADSAEQITKTGRIPMPAHVATVLRRLVDAARRQDQLEAAMGHSLR